MKKNILTSFLILVFATHAYAHDNHDVETDVIAKESHNIRLLKKISLSEGKFVYLTVRDEGHVLGQHFVVQLRASCNGEVEDYSNLKIIDSLSVCNMKPESVKANRDLTAVAFLSKTANINKYYDDIASGKAPPKVDCNLKTEIQKFSLRKICSDQPKS